MDFNFINKEERLNYDMLVLASYKEYYVKNTKKKGVPLCRILLTETLNNFYINIIDESGQTLLFRSAGLRQKHRLRTSIQTVEEMTEKLLSDIEPMLGFNKFLICLKSIYNSKMKTVVKLLTFKLTSKNSLIAILNQVRIPHNGVRGRKRRRK